MPTENKLNAVKRFRADHRHVVETEFDDAQYVGVADFDRVAAEHEALQQRLNVADQRVDELERLLRYCLSEALSGDPFGLSLATVQCIEAALNPTPKPTCSCPAGCIGAKS